MSAEVILYQVYNYIEHDESAITGNLYLLLIVDSISRGGIKGDGIWLQSMQIRGRGVD